MPRSGRDSAAGPASRGRTSRGSGSRGAYGGWCDRGGHARAVMWRDRRAAAGLGSGSAGAHVARPGPGVHAGGLPGCTP